MRRIHYCYLMRDGVLLFWIGYWRFRHRFHVILKENVFAKELLHRRPDPIVSGIVSLKDAG